MKASAAIQQLYFYLQGFVQGHFQLKVYVWLLLFLLLTVAFNYAIDFEDSYLDTFYRRPIGFVFYTLFFAFAYFGMALPQAWLSGRAAALTPLFWKKSLCFLLVLGIVKGFYHHEMLLSFAETVHETYFLRKILRNLTRITLYIGLLSLVKYFFDQKMAGLYGLNRHPFNAWPYVVMLGIMLPLIIWASYQPAFQKTYPMFKPWLIDEAFGIARPLMGVLYESVYALNFIGVELMFRGALVIGMASILGKDAVLPMVTTYTFLHFGKPLPETIGSIFGGYILGIIALRSQTIWGGCLIHAGVALLMDATAYLQHLSKDGIRELLF